MTVSQASTARGSGRVRQWLSKALAGASAQGSVVAKSGAYDGAMRAYMVMPGQPVWTDRNYAQLSQEAYVKNVIAHRAIHMVSVSAASVRLKLFSLGVRGGRKEVKLHPLLDLLRQPSPIHAMGEFFEALYHFRLISGNAYVQAVGPKDMPPRELHLLRPDRMMVIAGKSAMPAGYRYTVGDQSVDFPVDRVTGRSRILHLKSFHPLNDWYGLSPVEAAAYSIDQHNQSGAWNQALLQNGARPSGALVVRSDAGLGGVLSEDQYSRVKQQIDEQFSGPSNAGRPLLLEGGLDWKEMSLTPKDMDFIEAKNSSARDIALAFGVPPQLLGIPGDNTYANLQEARLALWEQTVVPLVRCTVDALGSWLAPILGGGVELVADTDSISALAIRNQAIWERVERASFLSENEKRAAVGYPPRASAGV
jgi:HK97 family phage portal protein